MELKRYKELKKKKPSELREILRKQALSLRPFDKPSDPQELHKSLVEMDEVFWAILLLNYRRFAPDIPKRENIPPMVMAHIAGDIAVLGTRTEIEAEKSKALQLEKSKMILAGLSSYIVDAVSNAMNDINQKKDGVILNSAQAATLFSLCALGKYFLLSDLHDELFSGESGKGVKEFIQACILLTRKIDGSLYDFDMGYDSVETIH